MSTETMPTTVIWWGAATAFAGSLVTVVAPSTVSLFAIPNSEQWHSAVMTMEVLVQIVKVLLPPLGAALIAAGLVMRYLDRRLQGERIADRPRRWRWPDDAREQA